jgi:acetyl-CoA carboxylase biotin carboxyl carrier protein
MDIETVRNLIQLMVDNDLGELEVQDGETRVCLKRRGEKVEPSSLAAMAAELLAAQGTRPETQRPEPGPAAPEAEKDAGLIRITSPMVGTFYASSDPESSPYVQIGSEVQPDTVVCIIEAMKVYNEIKAETTGVIEKILVSNEEPVEFGQPLFLVRPAS